MLTSDLILDATLLPAMAVALFGGVLSFLSPCVLPIVPPYLAYMSGMTMGELSRTRGAPRQVLTAAAFFVLGLSTVFLLLGAAASALGRALLQWQDWFVPLAGAVIMLFGLHFLGIFRIPILARERRIEAGDRGGSALGAYVLGLAFAFGWTPCLGPILGAILGIAATEASLARGTVLLAAYAVGLGIPFLLAAAFFPRLGKTMDGLRPHMGRIETLSGLLLWTVGLLMMTGQFTALSFWLLETFPVLGSVG
ncbi:Cytochrome c biogenesis protein [Rubellimicrobium thermophilum DSM 16684]|uniref:Cytochrome c biogenesis protein n=1 Tax=Rubellimicrobium thermophilum DSM 16684 TaxID=1123069 RepID=S9R5F7_9RHOB|nr:cytochrome c biogenesis protein CcdA [Rubellimicrobium thermophilum]EPX87127.1 Cytochrome c biogenesis protein [Rubellimicrobium thermophilum DSM 16684]